VSTVPGTVASYQVEASKPAWEISRAVAGTLIELASFQPPARIQSP
jgi:hypothetical protein